MVFIIALGAFFPVLLNTLDGVRSVKRTWVEAAMTLGATERQLLTRVILPGALPTIWTGIARRVRDRLDVRGRGRDDAGHELRASGYLILYSYNFSQVQVIVAGMIVIGIIGLGVDLALRQVELHRFRWRDVER